MYITLADLTGYMPEISLIQLSNDNTRATTVNEANVNMAIQAASEIIDGYLHGRYELPLQSTPGTIHDICKGIARYKLYQRRPEAELPKAVVATYEDAIKKLKEIQNGEFHVDIRETQQLQPEPGEFRTRAREKLDLSGY